MAIQLGWRLATARRPGQIERRQAPEASRDGGARGHVNQVHRSS